MMNKIVVTISGGICTGVMCDVPGVKAIVFDFDNDLGEWVDDQYVLESQDLFDCEYCQAGLE